MPKLIRVAAILIATGGSSVAGTPEPVSPPPSPPDVAAIQQACSEQANAKELHGAARMEFRAECKKKLGLGGPVQQQQSHHEIVRADDCKRRGDPRIGMSAKELVATCWGKPDHVNRTETANIILDQYVYGTNYVYLRNGVVTSIQSSGTLR